MRDNSQRLRDSLVQLARSDDISAISKRLWQTSEYRSKIISSMRITFDATGDNFIKKAALRYGNLYDYSKVDYQNNRTKVIIICRQHGEFLQTPNKHLSGRGCPPCGLIKSSQRVIQKANATFIQRAIVVHGDVYDYSKTIYNGSRVPIVIICKKHGEFTQRPDHHLNGAKCKICNESKGELKIRRWLEKRGLKFKAQTRFKECKYKLPLSFDFAVHCGVEIRLIEYDGYQHFHPLSESSKLSRDAAMINLCDVQKRDNIKNEWCKKHNIKLLRISYRDFHKIEHILSRWFGGQQ